MRRITFMLIGICFAIEALAQDVPGFDLENTKVKNYLNSTTYSYLSATVINDYAVDVTEEDERPNPVTINLESPAGENTIIIVTNSIDENEVYMLDVETGSLIVKVYNTKPQQEYIYQVITNEEIVASGSFATEGNMRMLYIPTMHNLRDLGGWTTTDGTGMSQYGLIYRGCEMRYGTHNVADDDALETLKSLGIRAEVDLRRLAELNPSGEEPEQSAFGPDASYFYTNISDGTSILTDYGEELKQAFEFVVECLRNQQPVLIHCVFGADRTGTLCGMIQGCIGLPADALYKDYELSAFSPYVGIRIKRDLNWRLLNGIGYRTGYDLKKYMRNYLTNTMGISQSDIDDLTSIMLGTYDFNTATSVRELKPLHVGSDVIYGIDGRKREVMENGLNIIRDANGKVRKVMY